MNKVITYKQLDKLGASKGQLNLFKELLGDEATVTEELCASVAEEFNWRWAVNNLLSDEQREAYEEAIAPYKRAYDEVTAPSLEVLREVVKLAQVAYREATDPALEAFKKAKATTFAKAYNMQE